MSTQSVLYVSKADSMRATVVPLFAIVIGVFMVALDNTAVNTILHSLSNDFGCPLSIVQWTVTSYMLAQATVIPMAGWLSDRIGAKRIFLASIVLFTAGSLLCSYSDNVNQLIFFRVLQGLGGGMVMPIGVSIVYRLSPPNKVGSIMGMMGVPIMLAPAVGPIVSGFLAENASWHWIFLINLPIGIVGLIMGVWLLPTIKRSPVAPLDLLGTILGPAAFVALAYGLSEGGTRWSSTNTLIGLIAGVFFLILFIVTELGRRQHPLLELRVFQSRNFSRGIVVQWVAQIALIGTIFLVPQYLQFAKGFGAFLSGLTLLPMAVFSSLFMAIGGKLFDKFGARPIVVTGMLLDCSGALILSHVAQINGGSLFMILPLAMIGSAMGLSYMPLSTHLMQAAPQHLVSRVTSLTSACQMVMNSLTVASISTLLSREVGGLGGGNHSPITSAYGSAFLALALISVLGIVFSTMLRRPTLGKRVASPSSN